MNRPAIRTVALLLSALALSQHGWQARAAEKVNSARLLPPKVYAYVSVPNISEFKSRFKESTLGGVLKDEAFNEFWDELKPVLEKASGDITQQLGVTLDDLLAIPTGEFAAAYAQPVGKPAGAVGLLDFGESRAVIEKLLEKGKEALQREGVTRGVEEIEGTEVVTYRFQQAGEESEDEDADKDASDPKESEGSLGSMLAYFIKDNYLVAGSNLAILENVLARWDGASSSTFADDKVYQYVLERSKNSDKEPLLNWYIDPLGLATQLVGALAQDNFEIQMALGFLPALGLSNLKAIGGSFDLVAGEYDSVSKIFIYVEQPMTGLLNVFHFPATQQSPPDWVAANVNTYIAANWDVQGAYSAIETLVDTFQGPGALEQILDQMAEQEGGLQLHLKKDVIDQLNGSIHFISDMADENVADSSRFLVALGVKDADKAQSVLSTLANTEGFAIESRDFNGTNIYEMDLPIPVGALGGAEGEPTKMGITVTKNNLMIANKVTLLEQIIRAADTEKLADSQEYKQIASHFPAQTSVIGYQDQSSQLKAIYELFRSGGASGFIEGVDIDFSKLPPFDVIEKYLPPSGSYAVPDERGALFVSFSLPKN